MKNRQRLVQIMRQTGETAGDFSRCRFRDDARSRRDFWYVVVEGSGDVADLRRRQKHASGVSQVHVVRS